MISALKFDERFPHTDPYFGDMESEIAELRTMTRVTKLRQQIECRQEGAWMSVRDVPDDRSSSGTRKVTTYGRATRSVTRSVTSDVNLGDFLSNGAPSSKTYDVKEPKSEAIVEFPEEFSHKNPKPASGVEITEVVDNESKSDDSEPTYGVPIKTSPTKKTSVVTLGQGNVVLIDPQDSNFKVTGMSKSVVGEEPLSKSGDSKKVKKVGFCKTEVHFAPDSGKVNIVETDEKPPSSQVLRRKKKPRKEVQKSSMPKLYFGDLEKEKLSSEKSVSKDDPASRIEHVFPVIREPSPLLSTSIANQARSVKENRPEKKDDDSGRYGKVGRDRTYKTNSEVKSEMKACPLDDDIECVPKTMEFNGGWNKDASFLRNVSPKLSKLISNNMQHEFQQKQMEIMRKSKLPEQLEEERKDLVGGASVLSKASVVEDDIPVAVNIHISSDESQMKVKPVKTVAQVRVSLDEEKAKAVQEPKRLEEPVFVNESKGVTRTINVVREGEMPKPKSSLTKIVVDDTKEKKRTKTSTLERTGRKSSTPTTPAREARPKKDVPKREVAVVKPMKPVKGTLTRPEPCRRSRTTSDSLRPFKPPKTQEPVKYRGDRVDSAKSKKSKEPLRSFEKVSNGWVGHCVLPVKAAKGSSRVSITTTSTTQSTVATSKNEGVKSDTESTDVRTAVAVRVDNKFHTRSSLTSAKQFSLSKEHLKSAKLVKELYKGAESKPDVPRPKAIPGRARGEDRAQKTRSIVSRRRLMYEEGRNNARRDSEQSDDSVIRADEEVRAYMFNSKTKVLHLTIGDGNLTGGRITSELHSNYKLSNPVFSFAFRRLWDSHRSITFVNMSSIKGFYSRKLAVLFSALPTTS